jgi:hypothetical protein
MSVRQTLHLWLPGAVLVLLLAGCGGPTRTSGTGGLSGKELAVLSIPQLPKEAQLQIHTIQFDGAGDEYEIGKGRDFYLLPRSHTASFSFTARVPSEVGEAAGAFGWLIPKEAVIIPGPRDVPLGALNAGKTYELATPAEGFEKLLHSGQLSLVREK